MINLEGITPFAEGGNRKCFVHPDNPNRCLKVVHAGLLEKIIKQIDSSIIREVIAFDVYEGENIPKDKKSVALNVTLQADDKTLSEKDLDQISKKIIDVVKDKTGATIRS